jgi:hypothetical protein
MTKYFLMANLWALAAFVFLIGRTTVVESADRFFDVGDIFPHATYTTLDFGLWMIAGLNVLAWTRVAKHANPH